MSLQDYIGLAMIEAACRGDRASLDAGHAALDAIAARSQRFADAPGEPPWLIVGGSTVRGDVAPLGKR